MSDISNKRKQKRAKLISLKGGVCKYCSTKYHPEVFDFHHRDPSTKKFSLGLRNMTRHWKYLVAEAEKCDLLCANCHRYAHLESRKELKPL